MCTVVSGNMASNHDDIDRLQIVLSSFLKFGNLIIVLLREHCFSQNIFYTLKNVTIRLASIKLTATI